MAGAISSLLLILTTGCGNSFQGNDFSSTTPASAEPPYYGKPTAIADADAVKVTAVAKFLYRQLDFTPGSNNNGLGAVISTGNAVPIPFAEFHIYDSSGNRIQQGETLTNGTAEFKIPKTTGTYTLKVFSRALNDYIKVSVLEDIYNNTPYSISQQFTITSTDIANGTKNISSVPVIAEANENISAKIEGGAFNIMFNILLANEYIRRNIEKNGDTPGVPVADTNKWWVAEKVTIYWKAGFNPYTYFGNSTPLSFYSPGERKLYVLGGVSGSVKSADTDHFDDSVILHEYGHFLEDVYGNSQSPGGSHTGDFIIDARLAWSEGWANYFQSAVLTGADAFENSAAENRVPSSKRFHYYVDTYGYKGSGNTAGIGIAFNLAAVGNDIAEPDNVAIDLAGTGTFREVSISRTLYKSTRATTENYFTSKKGGGVSFKNIWKTFSGEEKNVSSSAHYSLSNTALFPIPNMGLVNWLLSKNGVNGTEWDAILGEEKQNKHTLDYASVLAPGSGCSYTFTTGTTEKYMSSRDTVPRSDQQVNNDFYLYYHDGNSGNLRITYTNDSGASLDLDLILYYGSYVYFEDAYWYANRTSSFIARQSRSAVGNAEQVDLTSLPAGLYVLNIKINAYNKLNANLSGAATYTITKNGVQQCGTERP